VIGRRSGRSWTVVHLVYPPVTARLRLIAERDITLGAKPTAYRRGFLCRRTAADQRRAAARAGDGDPARGGRLSYQAECAGLGRGRPSPRPDRCRLVLGRTPRATAEPVPSQGRSDVLPSWAGDWQRPSRCPSFSVLLNTPVPCAPRTGWSRRNLLLPTTPSYRTECGAGWRSRDTRRRSRQSPSKPTMLVTAQHASKRMTHCQDDRSIRRTTTSHCAVTCSAKQSEWRRE
jgi:hypothetical protein